MHPLESYLRELREIRATGAAQREVSYYPPLSALFNELGKPLSPRVRCVMPLADQGVGMPDGGLFTADQFAKKSAAAPLPGQPPWVPQITIAPAFQARQDLVFAFKGIRAKVIARELLR